MRVGGIVLAGGGSSRMGTAKASLEWHGSTLVRRIAGVVERSVDGPVVIVRSVGQSLPRLPSRFEVVDDAHADRGPLEGLAAGMRALGGRAELAYASSTDVPFVHTSFVGAVIAAIGAGQEICVPAIGRGWHPLAAVYRTSLLDLVEELLDAGERRVSGLFERCTVRRVDAAELLDDRRVAAGDPELESVVNVNDPAAYAAARARPAPEISVRWAGGPQAAGGGRAVRAATSAHGRGTVRAATVGRLVEAMGIGRDERIEVSVDGPGPVGDPEFPLERGDRVTIRCVDAIASVRAYDAESG